MPICARKHWVTSTLVCNAVACCCKDNDVVRHIGHGFWVVGVVLLSDPLHLQVQEEALHNRVIPAVAFAAHAGDLTLDLGRGYCDKIQAFTQPDAPACDRSSFEAAHCVANSSKGKAKQGKGAWFRNAGDGRIEGVHNGGGALRLRRTRIGHKRAP